MPQLSITQAQPSDMSNYVASYEVPSMQTDAVGNQDETEYYNSKWSQQWGYFNQVPDLKSAVLMKATWVCGKGYTADPETSVILDHISGWGKDTFNDILFNLEVTKRIGGDAYAEIIRADDGTLLNLKPLDTGAIKIITDRKGIIKRYELMSKTGQKGLPIEKFQPNEIFHLSHNRLADQIHGISDILAMEKTILAEEENFDDMKKGMHWQVKPLIMFKLGTDDPVKIAAFVKKMDEARNKGENIYIPDDENAVSYEVVQTNPSQIIMQWRQDIHNKFYRSLGMPLVLFGSTDTTESGGKIEYTGHEQVFRKDQLYLEGQIWQQLQLRIKLVPPISLMQNLQTDQSKDANQGLDVNEGMMTNG